MLFNKISDYKKNIPWNLKDVVFVYFFVVAVIIFLSSLLIIIGFDEDSKVLTIGVETFGSFVMLYTIFLILTEKYDLSVEKSLGIYKDKLLSYANQGVTVFFILIIITTIINLFIAPLFETTIQDPYSNLSDSELRTISFFAILTAPFVEETFFRGFMQPAFIKKFGVVLGIIITALIFSLSHAHYLEYNVALITVFSIGLILGITKYKTQSIMPSFFAHLFNNIFAAMMLL